MSSKIQSHFIFDESFLARKQTLIWGSKQDLAPLRNTFTQ